LQANSFHEKAVRHLSTRAALTINPLLIVQETEHERSTGILKQ